MAVRAQHAARERRDPLPEREEGGADLGRKREADRIRNVDRRGAGGDRGLHRAGQEVPVRAQRVLGAELDVGAEASRLPHRLLDPLETLLPGEPELALQVDVGRRDEHVDARALRVRHGLGGALHVPGVGAGERRDDGPRHLAGDPADRLGVLRRARGEARLDHVDAELGELVRHAQLLAGGHAGARRLLAVPEGRVEDRDARHRSCSRGEGNEKRRAPPGARRVQLAGRIPYPAGAARGGAPASSRGSPRSRSRSRAPGSIAEPSIILSSEEARMRPGVEARHSCSAPGTRIV